MWHPWSERLDVVDTAIVMLHKRILELEKIVVDHKQQFAALEVRLSGPEKKNVETVKSKDTDWLERRKELTARFAEQKS